MAITKRVAILATFALAGVGGCTSSRPAPTPPGEVEPLAGRWKTWVLTSGSQLRLPPPPGEAASAAELAELRAVSG